MHAIEVEGLTKTVGDDRRLFAQLVMTVEAGELAVREEARGLTLPTAIWARWSR